ncbi:MAG: RNA polymerase sigma factor [Phycisphaerales bacterium]
MLDVPAITSAIARGDRDAFASLYCAKFDFVYSTARHALRLSEADALDVVQDAMLRVIRSMRTLPNEPALDAWLRRAALRSGYDRLRAERRRSVRERTASAIEPAPFRSAEHDERLVWLRRELASLEHGVSDAILFRLRNGLTLAHAGRLLGLKHGGVDGRVSRTVDSLRQRAEEDGHV